MKLDRERLQIAREQMGYSQEAAAKAAGIASGTFLRAEKPEEITPKNARKIARALHVEVADLLPKARRLERSTA